MASSCKKRVAFYTHGCRLNQYETTTMRDRFQSEGYDVVSFDEHADLAIINTCTVTRLAESKCRQSIRNFQRRNPDAYVAVVGCYSQTGYKDLSSIGGIDLILGNNDKMNVIDYIGDAKKSKVPVIVRERIDRKDFTMTIVGDKEFNKRANLKIQDGCDFFCSFCIIPFARGHSRSRDFKNSLEEANSLVSRGVKELVLTGVNLGTYDNDSKTIVDVIDALNDIEGLKRIRISSIEPTTISEDLFPRMNDNGHALMPYLHIPLQAGADKVLKEMRRKYSISEYLEFIHKANDAVDDLCLGADIMVGFPGESDSDFEESCSVLTGNPFAYAHVFTYSERDHTIAKKRDDHVPVPVRQQRSVELRRLSAIKQHDYFKSYLGKNMEVLFEDPREGAWPGYTKNYIRVICESKDDLTNRLARVRLKTICADYVEGEVEEVRP